MLFTITVPEKENYYLFSATYVSNNNYLIKKKILLKYKFTS